MTFSLSPAGGGPQDFATADGTVRRADPGAAPFPVVWITGASSGIGRELALRLARAGSVVAASARSTDALDRLVLDAEGLPGRIVAYPLDVADGDAVVAAGRKIVSALGTPDLCVLNAGIHASAAGGDFTAGQVMRLFDVNVFGTVRVLEAVIPGMIARRAGRIAVVASVAGYRGLRSAAAYGASKAALINMCEALRVELADFGVTVQLVNPGFVDTPMTKVNDFPMPFLMTVERAAEQFHRGLLTDRFEITFPKRFTWAMKALRLLPYAVYLPLMGWATRRR
ncbi:MAG: SDR family NAD(P)-dependent oxidoreductase [Rhodospirillaceae bacterium]